MKNLFNTVKVDVPKSNVFDLTHDVKLSLNMGELVPIMCVDCVPGDKVQLSCDSLLRFSPLVSPVMHRMDVTMHYFFVPNRLVWKNFDPFITNRNTHVPPFWKMSAEAYDESRLADYLGIPKPTGDIEISAIPFAAYQLIYNEYYRDQNLIPAVSFELQDGDNDIIGEEMFRLRRRAWEHDYFTAALPFAQAGAPVSIPLGDVVLKDDWAADAAASSTYPKFEAPDGTYEAGDVNQDLNAPTGPIALKTGLKEGAAYDPAGTLETESTTINDLRRAFRLQEWLEKVARGGRRYTEYVLSMFGVKSSDARLQRPEYITGTKSPVVISEVLNTTGTVDAPQGNMAGHGASVTTGKFGSFFCEEHGYIIGIMSVMPKTAYQQGIPKHFLRLKDTFDYYQPPFAHIGEQAVLNKELYVNHSDPDGTFGYVPRYAEYKFQPSRVAGDFRTTLNFWHLGRIFETEPNLNQEFIECNPTHRVFAVTDPEEQKLYAHVLNKCRMVRRMPKFGTPTF